MNNLMRFIHTGPVESEYAAGFLGVMASKTSPKMGSVPAVLSDGNLAR